MSDTQFTPGPWRWCGNYLMQDCPAKHKDSGDEHGKETNPFSTPAGRPIADDGSAGDEYSPSIDTGGPDARLIAAAPELYTSLAQIVGEWGRPNTPKWHRAEVALAKARGESIEPRHLLPGEDPDTLCDCPACVKMRQQMEVRA